MSEADASLYELPFEYILRVVKPERLLNRDPKYGDIWWLHRRPAKPMREAVESLPRFLVTPRVSKHRLFVWLEGRCLPDSRLFVFARGDDYFYGVLHSRVHEVWTLRMGARHGGERPTYNNTTCFETFPLPWPPGQEPWREERLHAIADAARELDEARNAWLNPPDATPEVLKKRTLTNLYNERPTWLANLHAALDRVVWAAYGWNDPDPAAVDEDMILSHLLALNLDRSGTAEPAGVE